MTRSGDGRITADQATLVGVGAHAEPPPATPSGLPGVGDLVAGKYRVERVIGEGGMGVVVAAHHGALDQRVAVKLLHPDLLGDRVALARFVREARAAAKIHNEHVVRVIDIGVVEGRTPFMVMEHLEGDDLAERLRRRGALPPEEAVDYVIQALDALADAHALGIVHRDLKPSNLFLADRPNGPPQIKLLDFGIAKSEPVGDDGPPSAALTTTSTVMGSPRYMAPEQVRSSKDVDRRADIWSIGVVLHELLTGTRPFAGTTTGMILQSILQDDPVPLRALRPELPAALEAVVARCLRRDRDERWGNVIDLAAALAPFASHRSHAILHRLASMPPGRSEPAPPLSETMPLAPPRPRPDAGDTAERSTVRLVVGERPLATDPEPTGASLAPPLRRSSGRARWIALAVAAAAACALAVARRAPALPPEPTAGVPSVAAAPPAIATPEPPAALAPPAAAAPAAPPGDEPVAREEPAPAASRAASGLAVPAKLGLAAASSRRAPPPPRPAPAAPRPRVVDLLGDRE